MIERVRNLSPRGEFWLVVAICFGLPTFTAAYIVLKHVRSDAMDNMHLMRGVVLEIACGGLALAILSVRGWTQDDFPIRVSGKSTGGGVLLWIIDIAAWWALYAAVVMSAVDVSRLEYFRYVITATPTFTVLFILLNSVFEEVFAAGYVIKSLESHGPWFAVTASAFIRSLYHIYQGPLPFFSIFLLGVLFAAVYWRWRNLYPLMVAHTLINLTSLLR